MRAAIFVLLLSGSAFAGKQSTVCKADADCSAPATCVRTSGKQPKCEVACDAKTKCPTDQRCVKDAGKSVCRDITDQDIL